MGDGLLISLGHGASAVLIMDNEIVNGYQLERITRVKGDSRFPTMAIEEIERFDTIPDGIPIYVSHWNPSGSVDKMSPRHWSREYLRQRFPKSAVIATRLGLSHHDAHAYSALAYFGELDEDSHVIVADGFGNFAEVLSIYLIDEGTPKIVHRSFGYDGSLGLLYQYATDYVGLKMNQDEWKLNAKASAIPSWDVPRVHQLALDHADWMVDCQRNIEIGAPDDPLVEIGALSFVHHNVHAFLDRHFEPEDKAQIAYFLQTVVETVLSTWIDNLKIKDVVLVGGCFLNVQLNGTIARRIENTMGVMPLSGDEGAPLGLFKQANPDFKMPTDLCWGTRWIPKRYKLPLRMRYSDRLAVDVMQLVGAGKIVNVVRSTMEFGPRAYCNTSTLAMPLLENAQYINKLNDRDPDMPMCPVISREDYTHYFDDTEKVIQSVEHMIVALDYRVIDDSELGVGHLTLDGSLTGRPQVIDKGHWLYDVSNSIGPLINTSFNNHGEPICYELDSILKAHDVMIQNDDQDRVVTLIEINGE